MSAPIQVHQCPDCELRFVDPMNLLKHAVRKHSGNPVIATSEAPLMPGTESTSARLARVVRERDDARQALERQDSELDDLNERYIQLDVRLDQVHRERDGVREELARQVVECEDLRATIAIRSRQIQASRRLVDELGRDLTLAQAELASARVELDHLRAERDAAYEAVLPANPPANRG